MSEKIAVFTTLEAALQYSSDCHDWLKANRKDYHAEVWDEPRKNPTKNEWGILCPQEADCPCPVTKLAEIDVKAKAAYVDTIEKMTTEETKTAIAAIKDAKAPKTVIK